MTGSTPSRGPFAVPFSLPRSTKPVHSKYCVTHLSLLQSLHRNRTTVLPLTLSSPLTHFLVCLPTYLISLALPHPSLSSAYIRILPCSRKPRGGFSTRCRQCLSTLEEPRYHPNDPQRRHRPSANASLKLVQLYPCVWHRSPDEAGLSDPTIS